MTLAELGIGNDAGTATSLAVATAAILAAAAADAILLAAAIPSPDAIPLVGGDPTAGGHLARTLDYKGWASCQSAFPASSLSFLRRIASSPMDRHSGDHADGLR